MFIALTDSANFISAPFFEVSSHLPPEVAYCFSCSIKESQAECFSALLRSSSFKKLPCYAQCKSVSDAVAIAGENSSIPPLTLLHCGIMDYGNGKEEQNAKSSMEDLFRYLESQIPRLDSEEGL